jgi:hypothetical protein
VGKPRKNKTYRAAAPPDKKKILTIKKPLQINFTAA